MTETKSRLEDVVIDPEHQRAAVAIVGDGGYSVGFADYNDPGYAPTTYAFESYADADQCAKALNEHAFGITEDQALLIVASSMKGGVR